MVLKDYELDLDLDYLEHAGTHKYINKYIGKNGRWVYVYDKKTLRNVSSAVINGKYGHGTRKGTRRYDRLVKEGYDFATIQNEVNRRLGNKKRHLTDMASTKSSAKKTKLKNAQSKAKATSIKLAKKSTKTSKKVSKITKSAKKTTLTAAKSTLNNKLMQTSSGNTALDKVSREVINGKWGHGTKAGTKRYDSLKKAGYDPRVVQNEVNRLLGNKKRYKTTK